MGDKIPTFYEFVGRLPKKATHLGRFAHRVRADASFPKDIDANTSTALWKLEKYLERQAYQRQKAAGVDEPKVDRALAQDLRSLMEAWARYADHVSEGRTSGLRRWIGSGRSGINASPRAWPSFSSSSEAGRQSRAGASWTARPGMNFHK